MSKHITEKQRYAISKMLQVPMSKKDIAEAIGVDRSNIYREIKRNCDSRSGKYNPDLAQRKADKRKVEKKRKEVFTQAMKKRVKKLLRKDLSPEQIVGRSQVENIAMVSHETIYCWIWQDKRQGGDLHKSLRRQGRKYSKRGSKNAGRGFIPNRVEIDQRPSIVEQKERFGDLEIDTIIGKNHKGAILTINDRATSRVWIRKLSGKEAIPVAKITVWALRKVKNLIHTITADNGKEFAKHEDIAQKLDINFYFCSRTSIVVRPPYCSISSIVALFKPSPSETMTTIDAVPITTPRIVRSVLTFLFHRFAELIRSKSSILIFVSVLTAKKTRAKRFVWLFVFLYS